MLNCVQSFFLGLAIVFVFGCTLVKRCFSGFIKPNHKLNEKFDYDLRHIYSTSVLFLVDLETSVRYTSNI